MKQLHVNSWDAYNKAMDEAKIRVAIDAGANDGGYTHTLLEHGFRVHAFEPVPREFAKMLARIGRTEMAILNNYGLSDKMDVVKGVTVLEAWTLGHVGDGGLQQSPNYKDEPPFDLRLTTIDDYVQYVWNTKVGIIKIDVDGHEFKVLRGGETVIRRDKPAILCEFGCYLNKLGEDPEAFVNFIFGLGYDVWSCDGKNRFTSWAEISPQWPYHTTFDVMLLPR